MSASFNYKFDKRDVLIILFIFILAISIRMVYLNQYQSTNIYPVLAHSDSYSYYIWAKDIASGVLLGDRAFMKWPLYAYFLGFLFRFVGENISAIYLLQFVLGAISCCLVYMIARVIFNKSIGFVAALLCVFYGLFMFYEGLLIYTSLSLFLNLILFLWILNIKDNFGKNNLFCIGIFLGICAITQANIAIFGVLAIIWILLRARLNWQKLALYFSYFIVGLSLIIGSVSLLNYFAEKDAVLLNGSLGINFYLGNNQQARGTFFCPPSITSNQNDMFRDARIIAEAEEGESLKTSEVSSFWFRKATTFIRQNPKEYLSLLFKKMRYVFSPKEFVHDIEYHFIKNEIKIFKVMFMDLRFVLPFAALGAFLGFRREKKSIFLYIVSLVFPLSIAVFFVSARYRISAVPFLMIFAAVGICSVLTLLKKREYLKFGFICVGLMAVFTLVNQDIIFAKNSQIDVHSESGSYSVEDCLFMSMYYENNAQYQKAIQQMGLAYKMGPNDPRVIFRTGFIHYKMNNFPAAEREFNKLIKINPLSVDAYYNLGFMYNKQQRFGEAKDMLIEAISLYPESAAAHFELALAYKANGEIEKSRNELNLALGNLNRWRHEDRVIIEKELEN